MVEPNSSCFDFDFSHDLEIGNNSYFNFPHDLEIENPTIETSEENIDSFLQNLDGPYINKEISYCDLEFENSYDLIFILNIIDVQTKKPKFKNLKKMT